MLVPVQVEGDEQHDRQHDRSQEQADGPPPALEALLGRGEPALLLVERLVGPPAADLAAAVGAFALFAFARVGRHVLPLVSDARYPAPHSAMPAMAVDRGGSARYAVLVK
jgi:hypothetical protein